METHLGTSVLFSTFCFLSKGFLCEFLTAAVSHGVYSAKDLIENTFQSHAKAVDHISIGKVPIMSVICHDLTNSLGNE